MASDGDRPALTTVTIDGNPGRGNRIFLYEVIRRLDCRVERRHSG